MVGQIKYCTGISEPIIETNTFGGQTITLPACEFPKFRVGKVYIMSKSKVSRVVNVGTEQDVILNFYFPKNKIIFEEEGK